MKNATLSCFTILLSKGMFQIITTLAMLLISATPQMTRVSYCDTWSLLSQKYLLPYCHSIYLVTISESALKMIIQSFLFSQLFLEISRRG